MNNKLRLTLSATNYCNLNCKYCSMELPYKSTLQHGELSDIDIKVVVTYINTYFPDFSIECSIAGGEPMLNTHLDKMLSELKHLHKVNKYILLTNGTIPFNSYTLDYNIFDELRISIHVATLHQYPKYIEIVLDNIRYLLKNKISPQIYIMKSIDAKNINTIYNYVNDIFTIYNIQHKQIDIVDTFSTNYYSNPEYDYSKVNSLYNQNYQLPVYYRRAIKIKPDMTCIYNCDLASQIVIRNNNAYYPHVWKYIQKHINDKIVCELPTCVCPIFCFKDE